MKTEHVLQLSNNFRIVFERGGGKMQVTVKEGDQLRATGSGELEDYKRMFDLAIGTVPDTKNKVDQETSQHKPGPGSSPTQQKPSAPVKTEPSKK
jgi:hypothetical protein